MIFLNIKSRIIIDGTNIIWLHYLTIIVIKLIMLLQLILHALCRWKWVYNIRPGMITCLMSSRHCISLFLWCHCSMFSMSQCLILDLSVSNIGSGMITCLMSFHHCISLFLWCHCSMFSMSQCLISDLVC